MVRSRPKLYQGNEACVEGALAAGMRFFAGYPITPSTEIAELCSVRLPQVGGTFIQMEDEIASMAAVCGASLTGVKAMTATSGPGFSLKQENIGFATEAEIPCVIVNVQRVGPSTGMPTSPAQGDLMQARWGRHGDQDIVALSPAYVEEVYFLTVEAFNISEELRTPVILLMDEVVGHLREKVTLPEPGDIVIKNRKKPVPGSRYLPYARMEGEDGDIPPLGAFGDGFRFHVTGLTHGPDGFPTNSPGVGEPQIKRINSKISSRREKLCKAEELFTEDAEVLVVSFGASARSAKSAVKDLRTMGIRAGLLRLITVWPFPDHLIQRIAAQNLKAVVVPEMNLGQLAREVRRCLDGRAPVIGVNRVAGKLIEPAEIVRTVQEVK